VNRLPGMEDVDVDDLAVTILGAMLRSSAQPNSGQLALDIANTILTGKMPALDEAAFGAAVGDILNELAAPLSRSARRPDPGQSAAC